MRHKSVYYKSKYKYVKGTCTDDNVIRWQMNLKGVTNKCFETEIEAAKAVDLHLIKIGKEPLNILKKL